MLTWQDIGAHETGGCLTRRGLTMFVGHYGPGFAIRAWRPELPLWLMFLMVQLVDIAWAVLVMAGVEKVRIAPGITAANPLDLYYMPYSHGLITALAWSLGAGFACRVAFRWPAWTLVPWVGAAVFSHWLLDLLVHRPDLPVYGDSMKLGLGLWNFPAIALLLEAAVLFGGLTLYLRRTTPRNALGRFGPVVFVVLILVLQITTAAGPPPPSPGAVAASALAAYLAFAAVAGWIDRQRLPRKTN
jgi:hypothetical protein